MADYNEISAEHKQQLKDAQLLDLAETLSWTVQGTNKQNAYSTHGVFRYFGKYPPPIGRELITEHTKPGDLVLDPTCGSGTTGVECLLLSRRAKQFDVNPVSICVANAKVTQISLEDSQPVFDALVADCEPVGLEEYPVEPIGLRNPEHWFLPKTCDSLRGIHRAVHALDDGPIRRLCQVAFLGTVRRVSRATTQQGRLFLDADTALEDAIPTFERSATRAINCVADLPVGGNIQIQRHDSREPLPMDELAKLCILHPPYFNAYKYSRVNSLELSWFGTEAKEIRKSEVREFFKIGKPEKAEQYVSDMAAMVRQTADAVAPGGVVAIMIGDTRLKGAHIPVTRMLHDRIVDETSLSLERVVLRVPRHTEASWVASQRRRAGDLGVSLCDYVVTYRKARG
jgi:hypothetical protein